VKVFLEIAEAAERLDELLDLVLRGDDVVICRAGNPVAEFLAIPKSDQRAADDVWALMAKGRPTNTEQTSDHDEIYDENGLPK
jgi:antitoxin (DNA-binding transcriptional repressor) of toxin-antitoxin stability system